MSETLNDTIFRALGELGFQGTLNDRMKAYFDSLENPEQMEVDADVTMMPAGTDAWTEVDRDNMHTMIHFFLPEGDKGDQGATGLQGPKGDKGDPGNTGATGSQGIQGVKGDTGPQGPKGDTGATGAKGDTGATGPSGMMSATPTTVTRPLNTPFTVHTTKPAFVFYTVLKSVTSALISTSTARAYLEYSTDGGTTWITVSRTGMSTTALSVTIGIVTTDSATISGFIPANASVRIRTEIVGTGTITFQHGQETL